MQDLILNILTLGLKPFYERQRSFHDLITDFRVKFSNPQRAGMVADDVHEFYEKLNNFNFSLVLFKDYYKNYIESFNQLKPNVVNDSLDLTFLRIALTENKWKPTKPYLVFKYHLRYKFWLTSKFFISRQKKQNFKKLNEVGAVGNEKTKKDSNKKWERVPINRDRK